MTWRSWLLLAALLGSRAPAQAESADTLAWRCRYDQAVHLTCVLHSAPAELEPVELPQGLPEVIFELRNNPESFRDRFVHIPLISPVIDIRFAVVLAHATMCGSREACSVDFELVPGSSAERIAQEARWLEEESERTLFGSVLPYPAPAPPGE